MIFLIAIVALYRYSFEYQEAEFTENSEVLTDQICKNIESTIKNVEQRNFNVRDIASRFSDALERSNACVPGSQEEALQYIRLTNALEDWYAVSKNVSWASIVNLNDDVIFNSKAKRLNMDSATVISILQNNHEAVRSNYGVGVWTHGNGESLFFLRAIFNPNTMKFCGYFIAEVENQILSPVFEGVQLQKVGDFVLYDYQSMPIYATNPQGKQLNPIRYIGNQKLDSGYVCLQRNIDYRKMSLVNYIDLMEKNRRFYGIFKRTVLLGVGALIFVCAFFVLTLGKTAKNINAVLRQINRISGGDFTSVEKISGGDEIGLISEQVQEMSVRIAQLLEQVGEDEKQRQSSHYRLLQARYDVLQSQVNPHFLYNVLQSINGIAQIHHDYKISEMVCRLANFFRRNLERRQTFSPLEEEMNYIENYLVLYQGIYEDRLQIQLDMDEKYGQIPVPTFILQPIVENSLIHGIENKIELCTIAIAVEAEGEKLKVHIRDNGAGIPAKQLQELRTFQYQRDGKPRVGLNNVQERLQMLYGTEYGLEIQSEEGVYTEVTVNIPMYQEEEAAGG
ncbi:MAG: histidine kinase [Lachnospiraceae bacterium]|nr:histidine kinase [Lachnospiraceae bacterium]